MNETPQPKESIESALEKIYAIKNPQQREKALSAAKLFLESLAEGGHLNTEIPEGEAGISLVDFVAKRIRDRHARNFEIEGFLDR
jgi:hypothetical protein